MSEQLEVIGEERLIAEPEGAEGSTAAAAPESAAHAGSVTAAAAASPAEGSSPRLRPDPLYHWILLGLSSAIVVLSIVLSVRNQTQVLVPVLGAPIPELCLMRKWSGHGCPGCGMTRCFISLGHGDLSAAWSYNPAGLWLFAIVLFQLPYRGLQLWRIRRSLPEIRTGWLAQYALGLLAVAMIAQWLLRLAGVTF